MAQAGHQLNWDLGKYGKGLVHNGNVHTWGTDVYDGQPTHPQYAEQALDMTASDYLHNPIFDSAFQIYPHGEVGMYESQGDLPRIIEQADPRLKIHDQKGMGFPEKRWDFQTRATTWRFAKRAISEWSFQSNTTGMYHFNPWTGERCECPYSALHRKMQRYAGMYINKVLKAPDKALQTPEGEAFKKYLAEHLPEDHESLAPWLAHRFKQGDIRLSPGLSTPYVNGAPATKPRRELEWWDKAVPKTAFDHQWDETYRQEPKLHPDNRAEAENNQFKPLYPAELDRWHAWYEAKQHPLRKGVNVMDKNFTPFEMSQVGRKHWDEIQKQQEVEQYRNLGQTVHKFSAQTGGVVPGEVDWSQVDENEPDIYAQWVRGGGKPLDPQEMQELADTYPVYQTPRQKGWHIKQLNNSEDAGAEGQMMGHCFGSEEQPYGRCLENGDITAYSLRDPKGKPHVTWHYNSDGSLAEMFGPNDDPIKPEYQDMLNEWGEKVGKDTDSDNAEGMEEQAEDPLVTLPTAEDMDSYTSYHHPDYLVESAQNMEGNIGPNTRIENESPDWEAIAYQYLDKGPVWDVRRHQNDQRQYDEFHDALGQNPGAHQDMNEALRDKVQREFPHWPQLDQDERDELPDHWKENLHRWDNWYNKPQQVNPWQFPSDLNHPTTAAMDPNINDHQIQMPLGDPAPAANAWGYQSSWITSSVIGDMRDGWGRFAVAAPWQLGTSGKGLYFPETGVLQTWDDNNGQTHLDVLQEDENAKSGNAHHLAILPNGTVRDQGCLDKDFADVDGDTEGLQRALRELDPRLKLEPPSDWAFNVGPTEVMETEPSAISRGEEGGSTYGVQTGGDFAGSL